MKREAALRRHLHAMSTLSQAITAMRSLSAHHFRVARAQLPPARSYRDGLQRALSGLGLPYPEPHGGPPALLVVASDLGVCGSYNARLVDVALERHRALGGGAVVHAVGRRGAALLSRAGVKIARSYPAPTGVAGVGTLLLKLVEDLLDDFLGGKSGTVEAISAQFTGVGECEPVSTALLPIHPAENAGGPAASRYVTRDHLAVVGLRELLYILVYELFLDALASEHGARLMATTAASDWLDDRIRRTARTLRALRIEGATEDLLDVVAGTRKRRAT